MDLHVMLGGLVASLFYVGLFILAPPKMYCTWLFSHPSLHSAISIFPHYSSHYWVENRDLRIKPLHEICYSILFFSLFPLTFSQWKLKTQISSYMNFSKTQKLESWKIYIETNRLISHIYNVNYTLWRIHNQILF